MNDPATRPVPGDRDVDVLVLGSANMDLVIEVEKFPAPGETTLARRARRSPGGKGANQAVAAARGGARAALLAAVGDDADGRELLGVLSDAGVDLAAVQTVPADTGRALVFLDSEAENSIVVVSGANAELDLDSEHACEPVARASIVLAQLEVPLAAVLAAARQARRDGAFFILNAAPARRLPDELLAVTDLLVVNEREARELAGEPGDVDAVLDALSGLVPAVIVTLGGAGSVFAAAGRRHRVRAAAARILDTTGAGDTYCGVLAAELSHDTSVEDAMAVASIAAALCVARPGAIPSIPTAAEVAEFKRAAKESDHG